MLWADYQLKFMDFLFFTNRSYRQSNSKWLLVTLLFCDVLKFNIFHIWNIFIFDKAYVFKSPDKMRAFCCCWDGFLLCVCMISTVKTHDKIPSRNFQLGLFISDKKPWGWWRENSKKSAWVQRWAIYFLMKLKIKTKRFNFLLMTNI